MSFQVRRFLDAQVPDVAAVLAKSGAKIEDTSNPGEIPDIKIEEPPKAPVTEPGTGSVETTATPAPTPAPVEQPSPEPAEIDWLEVLKSRPEEEVLQALGYDQKTVGFLNKWRSGEDLKGYFEALTTDYAKMSSEDLMRRQLHQEYPTLSGEDFEELFRMRVIENYKLDADLFEEKDVRRGRILLNADAEKVRQQFVEKQQQFLLSTPPQPQPSVAEVESQRLEQEAQEAFAAYKEQVAGDAFTKNVLSTKLLPIGEGEEKFNYEVGDPQAYLNLLYDPNWAAKLFNPDGTPMMNKQLLIAAIVNDGEQVLTRLADHYKMIGAKSAVEPIENASPPAGTPSKGNEVPLTPAAALAQAGVITSG